MRCFALLRSDRLQTHVDVSTTACAAVHKQPEGSNVCSSAMPHACLSLQAGEAPSSPVRAASQLGGPKQSAAVPDQTQAEHDASSSTAPPPLPTGVPGLTHAGAAADQAGPTRQSDEGHRTAEGRAAAPLQPAEGTGSAKVANAAQQADPSRQAPAQATGGDQDCASILQRAEAEHAREAEATAQMVADVARRAMPAVVQGLEVIAQPLVTALAEAVVRANLQAAAAARTARAQAEAKAVCEAAQVGTRFC